MFEFDCSLICRLRLPCLAVEVGEVGQEVTTGGAGETPGVPALTCSGLVSQDHCGAWSQSGSLQVPDLDEGSGCC